MTLKATPNTKHRGREDHGRCGLETGRLSDLGGDGHCGVVLAVLRRNQRHFIFTVHTLRVRESTGDNTGSFDRRSDVVLLLGSDMVCCEGHWREFGFER